MPRFSWVAVALVACHTQHTDAKPVSGVANADATEALDATAMLDAPSATPLDGGARVEFRPERSHAIHEHGGDAAHLREARFVAHNEGTRPALVSVVRVDFLTGSSCEAAPSDVRSSPKVDGLSTGGGALSVRVSVPPGDTPLTVEFAPVDAYYVYCNRFAFRVTFEVDGVRVRSTAETEVSRIDPIH